MKRQRQLQQASAPMFAILRISILSVVIISVDAFISTSLPKSHGRSASAAASGRSLQQPLWAAELKQSTTQSNDTAVGNSLESADDQDTSSEEYVHVEVSGVLERDAALGLSDEDMVQAMSEQMSDLLTTLDGNNEEPENDVIEIDNPIYSSSGAAVEVADEALEEEPSIPEIMDEMVHNHNDDDYYEEDPVLRELEETLLSTIQVLEDTLQETQIVNELETRELKEDQASLEKELQDQKQLNEEVMAKLQRVSSEQAAASQAPQVFSIGSVESLLDPSTIPEEGVVITSSDLTKLLQMQEEKHLQELKALESKLRNKEEQRLEMEESNVRLEAAASAAKVISEDTKQEDTVLQKILKEQQESLELANRKMEKLESELSTTKQELEEQTTSSKSEQAAAKTKEQELREKFSKMESEMKNLAMNDTKAQAKISNLEAAQTELEETLKKVKHEKAMSKAAATSAQKETKRAKQSLAESMAKIGRLETKQARAQIQSQPPKKVSPSPPKKATTTQAKQQPPKESTPAVTAQKTPRLDNWELTEGGEVQGSVFNHPSLPDGEPVRTSVLVNPKAARDGAMVKTGSGSRYKLGKKKTVPPPPPSAPKEPVATATKPEPVVKKQMPKQTASNASPSINLFSSFQAKPKNPVKKEEPKETEAETPKAKKSTPAFTSIFGATSSKAKKAAKDPEARSETAKEPKSTEAEAPKAKKSTPAFSSIFGAASSKVKKTKDPEAPAAETEKPKSSDVTSSKSPSTSFPLPRINFFGNTATEEEEEETKEPEDQGSKRQPYIALNIFGSKIDATDKLTHDTEKEKPETSKAPRTSAYGKRKTQNAEKAVGESNEELTLTGRSICNGKYLLAGKPKKSVTGRCLILGAYHADTNAKPTGNPIIIKLSENTEAMKKEHSIYKRVASGVSKGVVVKCHSFYSAVEDRPGKSALVLERGVRDLKEHRRWIGIEGDDLKEALYSVGQCLDSIHGARMVWTDLKTENFVVVENEDGRKVKAIDLESAMNLKDHPTDFTPEASPPEFAKEYVSGDPHSFVLDYSYDAWSFGMLAYELAAGVGYYDGNSPDAIMQKLSQKNVPNASIGIEDDDLSALITQCLSLDPKQRPSAQKIVRHPYFASVSKPNLFNLW